MKRYTLSINSLFIDTWPTRSFAIQNAPGLHKIFKPSLNVVNVRRVLSKLISEFAVGDFDSWYHGLLEEYGRISHILPAISKRPTFSLSEQPHRTVSVRNASRANSFRTST